MPFGHRQHAAHTSFADGGGSAQGIAVEGVELGIQTDFTRGLDEQSQVIAPVAREHCLRATGFDFGGVWQEVLDAAHRVQFVAHDLNVRAFRIHHRSCLLQNLLSETVILAYQIQLFDRRVGLQYIGERSQAHVGVGVKTEMPEAALFVGQRRLDG